MISLVTSVTSTREVDSMKSIQFSKRSERRTDWQQVSCLSGFAEDSCLSATVRFDNEDPSGQLSFNAALFDDAFLFASIVNPPSSCLKLIFRRAIVATDFFRRFDFAVLMDGCDRKTGSKTLFIILTACDSL